MTTPDPTTAAPAAPLQHTPLHALHLELGAKMVPFAGYSMPVSYPQGILAEHRQCRESAVLFDVSHMGQLRLTGDDAAAALETLVPVDVVGLAPGKQRYALFTSESGGILDDLMVTRPSADAPDGMLLLVVNAARKEIDYADLRARLPAVFLPEAELPPALRVELHLHKRRREAVVLEQVAVGRADVFCVDARAETRNEGGRHGHQPQQPEFEMAE